MLIISSVENRIIAYTEMKSLHAWGSVYFKLFLQYTEA